MRAAPETARSAGAEGFAATGDLAPTTCIMPTLADIAATLGVAPPPGGDDASSSTSSSSRWRTTSIAGVSTLADAGPSEISFVGSDAYVPDLERTRAAAVIVHKRVKLPPAIRPAVLIVDDTDLALAKVLELFASPPQRVPAGIDRDARIDPTATIGEGAAVAPFVVVGARSRIGRNCTLHAGASVGDDVVIGDDCTIFANVVVRERITIGSRVIVHAGAVIGTDGFGYRWDGSRHVKIPHIGTVIIEDDVEIGSCTCIDRAKFSATRIGRGTKIDNLVQIAHNCIVGPNCVLAGQVGLAGSVTLGAGAALGGQTAVSDHLHVGDGAMVAGRSGVATRIDPRSIVSGTPALPHRQTLREQGALRRLPELLNQVKRLEEELAELKKRASNQQ